MTDYTPNAQPSSSQQGAAKDVLDRYDLDAAQDFAVPVVAQQRARNALVPVVLRTGQAVVDVKGNAGSELRECVLHPRPGSQASLELGSHRQGQ